MQSSVNKIFKMNEEDLTPSLSKYTMNMTPSNFSNSKNKKSDKYNCFVTCRNMRKTHYVLKINMLWESGTVIKSKVESDTLGSFNNTYEFKRPIPIKRYPDIVQSFAFEVYDLESKKVLGYARFDFKKTHTEKDFLITLPIIDEETEGEVGHLDAFFSKCQKHSRNFIGLEASGKNLLNVDGAGDKSDPFLVFHRLCQNKIYVPIHSTTAIMDDLNPVWEKVMLAVDELCDDNYESPIKIECWDWQEDFRNQFIGETVTTLQEILKAPTLTLLARDGKKKTGELNIKVSTKLVKPAPTEFLTTQDKFSFVLGVDFSEYNTMPHNKKNLHGMDRHNSTPYLKALEEIAKIMWGQDADGKIPCFGFGGIPSFPDFKHDRNHSLIPLSGNNHKMSMVNPNKLVEAYKNALKYILPTNMPLITEILNLVKSWCQRDINENLYYVLIILTAGHIEELQKTIDILVDIAHLPVSVVLVGIGEYNFGAMEKLDGDKRWLRNSKKKLISRDIVNFVDYEECGGNPDKFSKKLLEEFPEQFMSFKLLAGYKPKFKTPPV